MAVALSSSPVGSSANITAGPVTSALAIATLCCSPPDISYGLWRARGPSPTVSSASAARRRRSRHPTPPMCSGSSTFSCAESSGIRPNDWNTKPMSLPAQLHKLRFAQFQQAEAVQRHSSRGGPVQAGHDVEQGRLSGAGSTGHRQELLAVHVHVHAVHRSDRGVARAEYSDKPAHGYEGLSGPARHCGSPRGDAYQGAGSLDRPSVSGDSGRGRESRLLPGAAGLILTC